MGRLQAGTGGVGYLLKDRVGNAADFLSALERVAAGGTALDRSVEVVPEELGPGRVA